MAVSCAHPSIHLFGWLLISLPCCITQQGWLPNTPGHFAQGLAGYGGVFNTSFSLFAHPDALAVRRPTPHRAVFYCRRVRASLCMSNSTSSLISFTYNTTCSVITERFRGAITISMWVKFSLVNTGTAQVAVVCVEPNSACSFMHQQQTLVSYGEHSRRIPFEVAESEGVLCFRAFGKRWMPASSALCRLMHVCVCRCG
jgi:hypothetical protein